MTNLTKSYERQYYVASELATTALPLKDIVHLGVQGKLALYVISDGWHFEAFKVFSENINPEGPRLHRNLGKNSILGISKQPGISELHELVRVTPESLAQIEVSGCTETETFLLSPDEVDEEGVEIFLRIAPQGDGGCKKLVCDKSLLILAHDRQFLIERCSQPTGLETIRQGNQKLAKPTIAFLHALIGLLTEIATRAAKHDKEFDIEKMPGQKIDLLEVARKYSADLEKTDSTFEDYLSGLCKFQQGGGRSMFYRNLFPEWFKGEED